MSRVLVLYRRVPKIIASPLAMLIAAPAALVIGIGAGILSIYVYDRGRSKGNDLAVFLVGLHAASTFALVLLFSWLRKLHSDITRLTPAFALTLALAFAALSTAQFYDGDPYYSDFVLIGWMLIIAVGCCAWLLSSRFVSHKPSWDEDFWKRSRGANE